jgi:quercetin dioxygenase-like cupin family protein
MFHPECEESAMPETQPDAGALSHTNWDAIPIEALSPLIGRQFLVGTNVMIARVLLKKGAIVPLHQHHNEQVSYILEGALKFILKAETGDQEVVVRANEVLCIPPNLPHEAHALEDTVDLDIFNPPRQDWIDRDDAYLRK